MKANPIQTQSKLVLSAVEWANLKRAKMNVNSFITKDYRKNDDFAVQKNKPNSNPIKPNLKRAKMNVNLTLTKDYRKKDDFEVRINKPNFFKSPK